MTHLPALLKPTWGEVDTTWGEPLIDSFMEGRPVSSPLAGDAGRHTLHQEVTHADGGVIHIILSIC